MRRIVPALLGTFLIVALLPAQADAQGDAQVTIADALTYDFGQPSPVTLCVDDVGQNLSAGDIVGPGSVVPGTYTFEIFFGPDDDCTTPPDYTTDITFAAGDDVTVMLSWTRLGTPLGISVLDNDSSCVEPGTGRVTLRQGAWTRAGGLVDLASGESLLIEGVPDEGQGSADLDAADYSNTEAVEGPSVLVDIGTMTVEEGEHLVIYLAGGNDGDSGAFTDVIPVDVCDQPTTTTAATVTPVAPAAQAAAVTPTFTG